MVDGIGRIGNLGFENIDALKTQLQMLETQESSLNMDSTDENGEVQIETSPTQKDNSNNISDPKIIDSIKQSIKIAMERLKAIINKINGTTPTALTDEQKKYIEKNRDFIAHRIAMLKMETSNGNGIQEFSTSARNWSDEDKIKLQQIASTITDKEIEEYVLKNWVSLLKASKSTEELENFSNK